MDFYQKYFHIPKFSRAQMKSTVIKNVLALFIIIEIIRDLFKV